MTSINRAEKLLIAIVKFGNINLLDYVCKNILEVNYEGLSIIAINEGNLEMFKYCIKNGIENFTKIIIAAYKKNRVIFNYLRDLDKLNGIKHKKINYNPIDYELLFGDTELALKILS